MNRRNAVLGWAVWEISKRVAKQKAKTALPAVEDDKKRRPTKTAIVATAAAIGGLLVFWRKRTSDDELPPV